MSERSDNASHRPRSPTNSAKMSEGDLGTRKTLFVLVIVVGCFAVLWPKVLYPMLVGPANQRMKPNSLDKGCCDVISDIDVNTIKIMTELCNSIIQQSDQKPVKGQDMITRCRTEVLNKCGIDISAVLQEQVRLGRSFKQIVDEVRSFNGSLCLKYNFGVSPWRFGVSHIVNLTPVYLKQERPSHLRPEMLHPALREKGRAIVQPHQPPTKGPTQKFIEGRPGPVPGVRPPMGGAGHVVHPPQKGMNSMGIIMPIYTVGIVIFFSYTLMKKLSNGNATQREQPSVKVLGMEMTASCEGGEKWTRPESPITISISPPPPEPVEPPQEIYLEGALPPQSQILVAESTTEEEEASECSSSADPAVILASKMTLSVIGVDSQDEENEAELAEEVKLRNGDLNETEPETIDDELVDESKYTTASGATAAERDISEDERTDGEDIEEEIEKLPECVVDNGVQQIEDIEDLQDDVDEELNIEEVIELESNASSDDIDAKPVNFLSPEAIESISDVIDDVINMGTRMSELRDSADEPERPLREAAVKFSDDEKPQQRKSAVKFGDISDEYSDEEMPKTPRKSAVKFGNISDSDEEKPKVPRKATLKFDDDISDDYSDDDKPKKQKRSAVKFDDLSDDYSDDEKPKVRKSAVKFGDDYSSSDDEKPKARESAVKFGEDIADDEYSDDEKPVDFISPEDIETISDVIDDVINVGTRMSELISAERDADSSDELNVDDAESETSTVKFKSEDAAPLEKQNVKTVVSDDAEEPSPTEPLEVESTAKVETKPTDVNG